MEMVPMVFDFDRDDKIGLLDGLGKLGKVMRGYTHLL